METILLSFFIALLCVYTIFALWQITIICGPEPENGEFHTRNELEVNWKINRPPILYYGILPFVVSNHLLFYWIASILGIIFVYIKTTSLLSTVLAAFLFFIGAFISLRILKAIALIWIKKHWQGKEQQYSALKVEFLKNILIKYNIVSWGFTQKLLIKSYKKEINIYTNFLKEHDDNFIATWLAEAILFRVDLENEGTLPSVREKDGSICPELIGLAPFLFSIHKCIELLKKRNEEISYLVLNLWYFTVLSLIKPNLLNDGKEMWNQLNRGMKNTNSELRRIIDKKYSDDPSPRMRAFDILNNLPPKQLNDHQQQSL